MAGSRDVAAAPLSRHGPERGCGRTVPLCNCATLPRARRGFSLIEMLVALAITSALLSASLAALDTSFKSYQMTSESSSTHVVTRIVMHRMLSMIRVGTEFGPFPQDVLATPQMVMDTTAGDEPRIQFVSHEDPVTGDREITELKVVQADPPDGTYVLTVHTLTFPGSGGPAVGPSEPTPLLTNLRSATFTLDYDVGPKLRKASIDLTVAPNDLGDDVDTGLTSPVIRLVASASPRNLD